jgi:CubicO group peptidase (beta-lactamase class C family)
MRPSFQILSPARLLAGLASISIACATPFEPAPLLPTAWEITAADSLDDGSAYWPQARWRTALPWQVGMDSAAMGDLAADVRRDRYAAMRSLLVVHNGYLVLNEYTHGAEPQSPVPIAAVAKTVTGLLVGIAVDSGLFHEDDGVGKFLPDYLAGSGPKSAISVDHFLTMRSGLNFFESPYDGSPMQLLNESKGDWLRIIFGQAMTGSPGEGWSYNSGGIIALGAVIQATAKEPADSFAKHTLFAKLGISDFTWYEGQPNHLPHMSSGLLLTSPDMARIGYLMLRNGRWRGEQVVSERWIAKMREHVTRQLGHWSNYQLDYGRALWLLPPLTGSGDVDVLAAAGSGGEWIFVVPSKDLVVVSSGAAYSEEQFTQAVQLLYDVIIPAVHTLP